MTRNRQRRGVALITALAVLVVVGGIATLMFARTLGEVRHSADDTGIVQSLLLARGAANVGGAVLAGPARNALAGIVEATSSVVQRWAYGTGSGERPDAETVVPALATVAVLLQAQLDALLCSATGPELPSGEALSVRIYVTESACGVDLPTGSMMPAGRYVAGAPRDGTGLTNAQTYALPFVIVAEGEVGPYLRNLVTAGEYRFTVGRGSFAQYALFTNVHRTGPSGSDIWFTDNTLFDGPVHTNQHFRYYRDPWFGGDVTTAGCWNPGPEGCLGGTQDGAYFYGVNGGNLVTGLSANPSFTNAYGTHAPRFAGLNGVDWNAEFIALPPDSAMQREAAEAGGLAFTSDLISLRLSATDADMSPLPTSGTIPDATYQMIEACGVAPIGGVDRHRCRQYRYGVDGQLESRVLVYRIGDGAFLADDSEESWTWMGRTFNGVIHTTAGIERLTGPTRGDDTNPATAAPALASFGQITVAADGNIRITGDLKYERPPCSGAPSRSGAVITPGTCDDLGVDNILGVYSQFGDVRIGHNNTDQQIRVYRGSRNAPDDVTIHGTLMSSRGIVGVDNYNVGASRGSVNLIGGIIEYYYGAFGTFSASTGQMRSGYSRAFTFDRRTGPGIDMSPPYFPTTNLDGVRSVGIVSFAQREQVE